MTNSDEAIREFAEKIVPVIINASVLCNTEEIIEAFTEDLTALISEHYVSKDEHEKMKHNLTHCGSCGDPLSRDCPRCKHLWET